MVTEWAGELRERLAALLGGVETGPPRLLPGGASKEAWAVDIRTPDGELPLLVRRAAGGVIHTDTLSLEHEYRVIEAAYDAGVRVPKPYGYLAELGGREAFVVERVDGATIGRRIVGERGRAPGASGAARRRAREGACARAGDGPVPRRPRRARPVRGRARLGRRAASGDRARLELAPGPPAGAARSGRVARRLPDRERRRLRARARVPPRLGVRAPRRSARGCRVAARPRVPLRPGR